MKEQNAPKPTSQNIENHDNRELYKDSKTGIETLLANDEGYIVGRINNQVLRYKTDAHILTISPTGGGKTTGCIITNLVDHPGSAFVIDIRGETIAKTANARRLMGQRVVVLDPYNITNGKWGIDSYNFFDRLTDFSNSIDIDDRVQRIVTALMFDPSGRMSNEPIWDNATRNLLMGLISYAIKYLPKDKQNLIGILDILNYSNAELEWFIAELTTLIEHDSEAESDRSLKGLVKILTEGKGKTKITDNAIIQAQALLTWVGNKSFEKILEYSTFTFEDLQNGKMTVYLVVPEEYIENTASWIRLLIESAIFSMRDIYNSRGISTASLFQTERVLFLLDELPAFGQLDIISKGMATLRGRGINLWLFLQNISQLDDIYGEHKARTIIGNAAAIQLFNSNELYELEYFVKFIGEEFYDVQSVGLGTTETKGQSIAKGTSHTISNSESVTHTKGTSDSVSEATSINWSRAYSHSKNKSKTLNRSKTRGSGTNETKNKGFNNGTSKTLNRNGSQGLQASDTTSRGDSKGKSKGENLNKSITKAIGRTQGETIGETNTSGGGKTETKTHTTNESYAYGKTEGYSDSTSETHTESSSLATNKNISVKQERMKIETVRSLREKLSDRNQLLQIRDHQPFFVPKMSYFVKYIDQDRFMFPEMFAIIDSNFIGNLLKSKYLNTQTILSDFSQITELEIKPLVKEIDNYLSNKKDHSYDYGSILVQRINELLENIIDNSTEAPRDTHQLIQTQTNEFDYIASSIFGFLNRIADYSNDPYFKEKPIILIEFMKQCDSYLHENNTLDLKIEKYQKLPIRSIKDGWDKSIGEKGYNLSREDYDWLLKIYQPVISKLIQELESNMNDINTRIQKQDEIKQWLIKTNDEIEKEYPRLIESVIMKEIEDRQKFFKNYIA